MKTLKIVALSLFSFCSITSTAQENESLLWEISGKNLSKPSYVFGTIHMICEDDYIMTDKITNTLQNVDEYYAEINFADPTTALMMQQMMVSETPLSKRLSTEKYNELKTLLTEVIDLDINAFENLNDAAIASMITYKSFHCTNLKMYEIELLQKAVSGNKKLGGLETVAQQMKILGNSLNMDAIFLMLDELKTKGFETTNEMVHLYKSQQISELYNFMKRSNYMTDEVYNEMLTKRNHNWIEKMPNIMQDKSVFFAVGAAHLGGDNGILKLLKNAGYQVNAVNIN